MQCRKCGTEFEGMFCPKCGEKIDEEQMNEQNQKYKSNRRIWTLGVRIGILVTLICFALPFFSVSCSAYGENYQSSYSGFQLMAGGETSKDDPEGERKGNAFICIAFVCAAASLAVSFIKNIKKFTFAGPVAAAFMLLISKWSFVSYYGLKEYKQYGLTVSPSVGYFIVFILLIAAAGASFIVFGQDEKQQAAAGELHMAERNYSAQTKNVSPANGECNNLSDVTEAHSVQSDTVTSDTETENKPSEINKKINLSKE